MKHFKCKHCDKTKEVSFLKELFSFHLFGKWVYVKCPKCGKRSWMKRVKEKNTTKYQYIVHYIDVKSVCHSIGIEAFDCKELLNKIAKQLPKDAKYILSMSINKLITDGWGD